MSNKITETIDNLMLKLRDYGELIVAVVLFIFFAGLRIFISSFMDLSIERWRFVSPAFWPSWILLLGALLSAFFVYNAYQRIKLKSNGKDESECPDCDDQERELALRAKYQTEGRVLSLKELEALAEEQIKASEEKSTSRELIRLISILVLTFIYLYVIRLLGFIPSTLLFSFSYLFILKEKRPLVLVLSPVILVAVIWFVFTNLLVVPLPRGEGVFHLISTFFY
jgi:hypothetical protein